MQLPSSPRPRRIVSAKTPFKRLRYALVAAGFTTLPAFAADSVVMQKSKTFSVTSMTLRVGDTVRFVNADTVIHNITMKPLDEDQDAEDLGLQKPGQPVAHKFTRTGPYRVLCSIHPRMRIDIDVK